MLGRMVEGPASPISGVERGLAGVLQADEPAPLGPSITRGAGSVAAGSPPVLGTACCRKAIDAKAALTLWTDTANRQLLSRSDRAVPADLQR